jgi:Cu/Ag efflux pump CusA
VGFVVDGAIVMIEIVVRHQEMGKNRTRGAGRLEQIAFTSVHDLVHAWSCAAHVLAGIVGSVAARVRPGP